MIDDPTGLSGGGGGAPGGGMPPWLSGLAGIGLGASQLGGNQGFQPTGMPFADQQWQQDLAALSARNSAVPGMVDPQFLQSYMRMLGIDMSPLVTAGQQAGDQYKQLGSMEQGLSQNLMGQGQQIQQQAFDPQNQLHDLYQQQTVDQSRGADSSRGLAMSPYSSGNESTALRNFNMDWQNRQLGREMAGGQAAQQAYGGAFGYASGVPGTTMQAAQAPIGAQQMAAQWPAQAAQQYAGNIYGSDPYSGIMQQIDPYMRNTFGIFGASPEFRAGQTASGVGSLMGGASQLWPYLSSLFSMGGDAAGGAGAADLGAGAGDLVGLAAVA